MKKYNIKNGMHVITKDGTEYVIISKVTALEQTGKHDTIMVQINDNGWMPLDNYDDDLHHKCEDDFDIKAVYMPLYFAYVLSSVYDIFLKDKFIKIWERPTAKKMTKADIEKELGYEIEVVE